MIWVILPADLILPVIDCLIPATLPVVFGPGHVITRRLLSLILVCKLVSRAAKQLIFKHCLCIDSAHRLGLLLQKSTLSATQSDNLNIPPTVYQIEDSSAIISANLTSLIIDIPFHHLYPEDDVHQLRPILRTQSPARPSPKGLSLSAMSSTSAHTTNNKYNSKNKGRIGRISQQSGSSGRTLKRLVLYNVAVESSQFIGASPIVNARFGFLHTSPVADEGSWERSFVGRLHALRYLGAHSPKDMDSGSDSVTSYLALRMPFGRDDDDDISICQGWLLKQASSGALWWAFVDLTTMTSESFLDLAYGQPETVRWESKLPNLWTCDVCSAVFQRVDHFKRHSATHRTDKLFSCDFCGSAYKRGSKRSCSGGQPCSECRSRERICSYDRLRDTVITIATQQSEMWSFPRVEGSAVSHDMGQLTDNAALDRRPASGSTGSTWTLGPQNFYASADVCYKAYSRLR
ncbi:hypothetical protein BDV10DRAFT_200250 [Aspergillus recurvatus]